MANHQRWSNRLQSKDTVGIPLDIVTSTSQATAAHYVKVGLCAVDQIPPFGLASRTNGIVAVHPAFHGSPFSREVPKKEGPGQTSAPAAGSSCGILKVYMWLALQLFSFHVYFVPWIIRISDWRFNF